MGRFAEAIPHLRLCASRAPDFRPCHAFLASAYANSGQPDSARNDARSGDFAPLRFVPPSKTVVLGLVSSKLRDLEAKDDIRRRIDEAARFMPLDQLCLSPQCGFSSTVHGNAIAVEAKLALVVETAGEVWGTT